MPSHDRAIRAIFEPKPVTKPSAYTVLLLDAANSMEASALKARARTIYAQLLNANKIDSINNRVNHVAVATFSNDFKQLSSFESDWNNIAVMNSMIDGITVGGSSNISLGLEEAGNLLNYTQWSNTTPVLGDIYKIILVSNGLPTLPRTAELVGGNTWPYNMSHYAYWRQANITYEKAMILTSGNHRQPYCIITSPTPSSTGFANTFMRDVAFCWCGECPVGGLYAVPHARPHEHHRIPLTIGDVNGDQDINIFDALDILNHIYGKELLTGESLAAADATQDGVVDISDVLSVMDIIFGRTRLNDY
jgi:hypothetical protein